METKNKPIEEMTEREFLLSIKADIEKIMPELKEDNK